jgi:hypothetical protein
MEEALQFFRTYEIWIYIVLGLFAIWQIRKFILAWDELRGAVFSMERDSAQARLNSAAILLVLLLAITIIEFMIVTFVVPTFPGANPLSTPTLNLLATATTTLSSSTPPAEGTAVVTAEVETAGGQPEGCIPNQVVISSPLDGDQVSGEVSLIGTANIPNFGFYKYEIARPGETVWLPIQVGEEVRQEELLGTWDTSTLDPGDYSLRLIVTDNQGNSLPACTITVRVISPPT